MRIIYYGADSGSLFVQGARAIYEYANVREFYYRRIMGYIKRGWTGKAWNEAGKFRLVAKGK